METVTTTESLDVSCRATAHVVYWFLMNNRPASCLVIGLPYSLAHLQNASASISWDHYLIFLHNCHSLLSEEEWIEQSYNYDYAPYLRSMMVFAGLWLSPSNCFAWGLGNRGNLVGNIFRCINTASLKITRNDCEVEYQLPKHYALPPNYFWQAMSCGFAGSASVVGLSPIIDVTWQPIERGAKFRIVFPRPSLFRFISNTISRLLRRDSARQSRINQKFLMDREHWLQQEISRRIESEQALRESEAQLRVLMEAAPEAIVVFDLDEDRIISANGNAEVLFNIPNFQLLQTSLYDLIRLSNSQTTGDLRLLMEQVLSGRTAVFEFSYGTSGHSEVPCEARLVRLPSNKKLLIRARITNISARKRAEIELVKARDDAIATAAKLQLREQELTIYANRLREVISITGTGIFDHNHVEGTMYHSAEFQQIYGRQSGVSPNVFDFMDWVVEADRELLLQKIIESHDPKSDGQFQHVYRAYLPSGEIIWCEAHATTSFEGDGDARKPVRTVGAVVNVTERITREELLKNSRQYLQAILESTTDIVFSLDRNLCYLAFNRQHFEKMQEAYDVEISVGGSILDYLMVDQDREIFEKNCLRAFSGERFVIVQPYGDPALTRSPFQITFNPMRDEAGNVTGVAVFARDTSGEIRAQNALRESEELQRLAIEVSELGIWRFKTKRRRFTLDSRCQKLFGFTGSEVGELDVQSRIHPEDLNFVLSQVRRLYEPDSVGIFRIEHRIQLPDNSFRWVTACGTRLQKRSNTGDNGELEFIGTLMDITEQVETSNLLTASLREKDVMLKEIHHRVKNNLQVIVSLLSLQAAEVQSEAVKEFSAESQRRVRAMALVHETLYQTDTLAKIDMTQYLAQLCDNLIQSYGLQRAIVVRNVDELQLELDQALPIGLIMSELITNSIKHAFPERLSPGHIFVGLQLHSNESLMITVYDDGIGLPTNLDTDTQSSLGLKLVRLLSQQLRGHLLMDCTSGTPFKIEIPYARPT